MIKIAVLGEILVEIMATRPGQTFDEPGPLTGPYASGAPAIFAAQAARLGQACGIAACVGNDAFGRMATARLRRDGVDVAAVAIDPARVTGSAFVRYEAAGGRAFVFNMRDAACGRLAMTDAARTLLAGCGHLHVTGSSLFASGPIEAILDAVATMKSQGGTVSFDPNLRPEVMHDALRAACVRVLAQCDLFLPSGGELTLLTRATTEADAIAEILDLGVGAIVRKRGAAGATYLDDEGEIEAAALPVTEVDPTGAGDCFAATYVTCRLRECSIPCSLVYATAAGAHAVSVMGPMEGTSSFAQLDAMLRARA